MKAKTKLFTVMMCVLLTVSSVQPALATTYPDIDTWYVMHNQYYQNSPDTVRVVSYGSGYYARMTAASGSDPLKAVRIHCTTNSMTDVYTSTIGLDVLLSPSTPFGAYVDFEVWLQFNSNYASTNQGSIRIKSLSI